MANQPYSRPTHPFAYQGMSLNKPPDSIPDGKCVALVNVTPEIIPGSLQCRPGLSALASGIGSGTDLVHSIRRLNDSIPGAAVAWARAFGSGVNLWLSAGGGSPYQAKTGFSGNPVALVPFRPPNSNESWMYVYDSAQQCKFNTAGTVYPIGVAPPAVEPTVTLDAPVFAGIGDTLSTGGWSTSGSASSLSSNNRSVGSLTTVIYDSGNTGWASVQFSAPSAIPAGAMLAVGDEFAIVHRVFPALSSMNVAAVTFDSGTTGMCTVVPNSSQEGMQAGMILSIGGNQVVVTSVTQGPDGNYSFRCNSPVTLYVYSAITSTITFRMYFRSTHSNGELAGQNIVTANCVVPSGSSSGVGSLIGTGTGDYSQIYINGIPHAIKDDDYVHFSFSVNWPQYMQEVHFCLDLDGNGFQNNYLYWVARQGDISLNATGQQTVVQSQLSAMQANIAESYGGTISLNPANRPYPNENSPQFSDLSSDQLGGGYQGWYEAMIRIGDMTRVGSDPSKGLSNVYQIGVKVIHSSSITIALGNPYVLGTSGPDVQMTAYGNKGLPIIYRYRYRSSKTGTVSDVSPSSRTGVLPWRTTVNVPVVGSPSPEIDLIDIERNGGSFDTWRRCLTVPNATYTVKDNITESVAAAGEPLELQNYLPWPVVDKPRIASSCNVTGTRVVWNNNYGGGDTFNTNWVRGTEVIINNKTYTLHASPSSIYTMDLEQSAGWLANVPVFIPEPVIQGVNLPYACSGMDGRIFATGDTLNPGLLYFSNAYSPDTASDAGYIEITSPNDPLGPPVYYEGAIYVHTSSALYRVDSTSGGANPYAYTKLGGVNGLVSPWAVGSNSLMVGWLGPDGIYVLEGQSGAVNISAADIGVMFPVEGRPGLAVTIGSSTILPVDMTSTYNRVSVINRDLYFTYKDIGGNANVLVFSMNNKSWRLYQYQTAVSVFYLEEGVMNPEVIVGGNAQAMYLSANASDLGTAFNCTVITPADNQGDPRMKKQYGDVAVDMQAGTGTNPSVSVYFDNFLFTSAVAQTLTDSPYLSQTRDEYIFDITQSAAMHRNIGLYLSWPSSNLVQLYNWQPSFIPQPEDSVNRPTDWMDGGTLHYKFVRGLRIRANTYGITRQVNIVYDGGVQAFTLSVNHDGETVIPYTFPPFKARMVQLVPADANLWQLFDVQWEFDNEPDPVNYWVTQPGSMGFDFYGHIRDFVLAYASVNSGSSLTLYVDGVPYLIAPDLPSTGGLEVKNYFSAPPVKGMLWQWYLSGTAIQMYKNDCIFRMKPWGGQKYASVKPIGDDTWTAGAKI